jgi:hypothetical protein
MSVARHREADMSKQSEQLRDQARRTENLSRTVGDERASKTLKRMSEAFDEDAARLENSEIARTL